MLQSKVNGYIVFSETSGMLLSLIFLPFPAVDLICRPF